MLDYMDQELDKLQIASVRLADTIHGFFAGNHTATTIDNARAVSVVTKNIKDALVRSGIIQNTPLLYEGFIELSGQMTQVPHADQINSRYRLLSNFVKHADKDAHNKTEFSVLMSLYPLFCACMDYDTLVFLMLEQTIALLPDERSWIETPYGEGTKTLILSGIYRDYFSSSVEHKDYWTDRIKPLLEPKTKKAWHDIIIEEGLWPIDYDAGISLEESTRLSIERYLTRGKGADFSIK